MNHLMFSYRSCLLINLNRKFTCLLFRIDTVQNFV